MTYWPGIEFGAKILISLSALLLAASTVRGVAFVLMHDINAGAVEVRDDGERSCVGSAYPPFRRARLARPTTRFRLVRRLWKDRRGATLVTFALMAPTLFLFVALTIEYGLLLRLRMRLDAAADAAALTAVSTATSFISNYAGAGDPFDQAALAGQAQAVSQFYANAGALTYGSATPAVKVTRDNSVVSASVSYTYSTSGVLIPSMFQKAARVAGASVASMGVAQSSYVNIFVVIDNSESMGIGATAADQQIIYAKNGHCSVACHYSDSDTAPKMRAQGAALRIDAEKAAVDAALAGLPTNSTYQVAIYTMAESLVRVSALSKDISAARQKVAPISDQAAAASIDLAEDRGFGGAGSTDFTGIMAQLYAELNGLISSGQIEAPGDGSSPQKPKSVVILVTDGIQNSFGNPKFTYVSPCQSPTCDDYAPSVARVQSMSASDCAAIKKLGFRLMTLNADYLIPDQTAMPEANVLYRDAFNAIRDGLTPQSRAGLKACASAPSDAFSGSSPQELADAVKSMVGAVASRSSLKLVR